MHHMGLLAASLAHLEYYLLPQAAQWPCMNMEHCFCHAVYLKTLIVYKEQTDLATFTSGKKVGLKSNRKGDRRLTVIIYQMLCFSHLAYTSLYMSLYPRSQQMLASIIIKLVDTIYNAIPSRSNIIL